MHPRAGYSITYRVGGKQRWEAVGRNKKEARQRLVHVLSEINSGTYREIAPITFLEFSKRWLKDYAQASVRRPTLRRYLTLITHQLNPAFGSVKLTDLTLRHIQRYVADSNTKRTLAPRTINHSLVLLKQMLKSAVEWGYLRNNPAQGVKLAKIEHQEMDYLTPDEIRLVLQHSDEPYRTLFLTAVLTGMRQGELLGLQWGDVDWSSGLIYVRRSVYWSFRSEAQRAGDEDQPLWRFASPKSKRSVRAVRMSPGLKEALELHKLTCITSPFDLVFCTSRGTPISPSNMIGREFHPALARAGLRRVRFHDLRHTFTTLLIAEGASAKFIQSQLGHASVQLTLDRYGHLLPDAGEEMGSKLDARVFGTGNESHANTMLTKQAKTGHNSREQEATTISLTPTELYGYETNSNRR